MSGRLDEEIGRLVATVSPSVDVPTPAEVDRVWNRVAGDLDAIPARRRPVRLGIGAGVVVVLLASGGVAAASFYSARTGHGPVDAEDLLLGGPGERLDPAGTDIYEIYLEETADIPFPTPDADARRASFEFQLPPADRQQPGVGAVSTGALRSWVAADAVCAWANHWAKATAAGDPAARVQAITQIRRAPAWPAVVDADPHPHGPIDLSVDDGKTTRAVDDMTPFYYLAALGEAVGGRDSGAVASALQRNGRGCVGTLVPDFPQADPMQRQE